MAKRIKTYKHSNEWGEYTVHEYSNGIIVKSLTNPSQKYKDKIEKRQSEHKKKQAEKRRPGCLHNPPLVLHLILKR